jgi:hypothetical protein
MAAQTEREPLAQKKKVFSKVKAVKDAARENIGSPKPSRAIEDAKTKAEMRGDKHKKAMERLIEEE